MKKNKKFIIAANWKMNPQTKEEAKKLFSTYKKLAKKYPTYVFTTTVPTVFLETLSKTSSKIVNLHVGAENIYIHDQGSYTGAISVPMVKDSGAELTLIGHSERRNLFKVSNELISKKIEQCVSHKLPMVVCFGEKKRDEKGVYVEELEKQLSHITQIFKENPRKVSLLTLAYEPVWAIGADAKRPVTEEELFSTILLIKNIISKQLGDTVAKKVKILYGGSVNPTNAKALSQTPGVDGFLIGRAGLTGEVITQLVNEI